MENQAANLTNKDAKAPLNAQQNDKTAPVAEIIKNESTTATQFDPKKEGKHGADFCCGSCGG